MKGTIASVIGMAMTLTPMLSMTAMAAGPQSPTATQSAQVATCPMGTHWEAAGYNHGRWRAAHCANDQAPHY